MKNVRALLAMVLVLSLAGVAWAAKPADVTPWNGQPPAAKDGGAKASWQTNILKAGTATLRKIAVGTMIKDAADDTIRLFTTQSASPRNLWLFTDTSTASTTPIAGRWVIDTLYRPAAGCQSVGIGDVDRNGLNDLVFGRAGAAPYRLMRRYWTAGAWNTSDSVIATAPAAINDLAIGDADNDAVADEIIFVSGQRVLRAYWNGASFDTTLLWAGDGNTCYGVAIGDFDAGHAGNEIVAATYAARAMKISFNGATWDTMTMYYNAGAGFYEVAVGDFDAANPGAEIAIGGGYGSATYGSVMEIYGSGSTWTAQSLYIPAATTNCGDLAIGDFLDENPGNEILFVSSTTGMSVRAVYGSGTAWSNQVIATQTTTGYGAAAGDIDKYRAANSEVVYTSALNVVEAHQYWPAHDLTVNNGGPASYPFVAGEADSVWAQVKNNGSSNEGAFNVILNINAAVAATVPVAGLNAGDSIALYLPFTAGAEGAVNFAIYHDLATDELPGNDTLGTLNNLNLTRRFHDWAYPAGTYKAEGFEYLALFPPAGWATINNDGGASNWSWFTSTTNPRQIHTGRLFTACAYEASAIRNDDWLVSDQVTPTVGYADSLRFYYRAYSAAYPESLEIWGMNGQTVGDTIAGGSIWQHASFTDTLYQRGAVSLDAFDGQSVNIGLRNHSQDQYYIFIDDISWSSVDVPPAITYTSPADAATGTFVNAPVVIGFSEPVDQGTFAYTCAPDPGSWIVAWNAGGDTATLTHSDFATATPYTFQVTVANDLTGNPLAAGAVPNPFTFTTNVDNTFPTILAFSPADAATDVAGDAPIFVAFSEAMDTLSVAYTFSDPTMLTGSVWSATLDTLALLHNELKSSGSYTLTVSAGADTFGLPLSNPGSASFTVADITDPELQFVQEPASTYDTFGPYLVRAVLIDSLKAGLAADSLFYQVGNDNWVGITHSAVNGDTFDYAIPGPITAGTQVSYQLVVFDNGYNMSFSSVNTFTVLNPLAPGNLAAQPLVAPFRAGLSWNAPSQEMDYTDATPNWIWYGDPGDPQAVRFTPQYTPAKLTSANLLFYNTAGNVEVHVWSDSSGIPGHDLMTPVTVPISQFYPNWTTVDLSAAAITVNEDYHIGYVYLAGPAPRILADVEEFTGRSQFRYLASTGPDTAWTPCSYYGIGDWFITSEVDYGPGAKAYASQTPARRQVASVGASKHAEAIKGLAAASAPKNIATYTVERDSAAAGWGDWRTGLGVLSYEDSTLVEYTSYGYRVKVLYSGPDTLATTGTINVYADFTGPDGIHTSPADDDTVGTYVTYIDLIDSSGIQNDSIYYWQPPTAGSPTVATHDSVTGGNRYWFHIVTATRDSVFYQFTGHDNSLWHNRGSSSVMSFRTNLGVSGQPTSQAVAFYLGSVAPNPVANGKARFEFGTPVAGPAKLEIFNVIGQKVKTLVSGNVGAGRHTYTWNGCDDNGRRVSSGVFMYRLSAAGKVVTRKLTVVR